MLKIFISSHGHFASGIKSSVEILMGPNPRITVFDAYINQESVQENLDAFYETVGEDDKVLLLSDLYGGSVNQVMYTYLTRPNTRLVAGVNLALVLELAVREEVSDAELEELVEQSRTMLRIVELEKSTETKEEDEDFF
ncbi:MAG: PTS sugar transporter subunit IIA [Erysipelotrichaceae bacterium]|nr:PTS sugar transporter subunit IIA [Erysipelotrichaceae bacterium]MBQ1775466.1 PTS sugar transporter subunit IIA [Erysipelotrichaceae bacterium]MBQ1910772.1 PTS sugar transporter subunit IIA [Erysipelotrichaceae bacterium]MBQ2078215.1 PTS sugar transporter subunit IIA [Erysipelotrichaceae bacterium]MBQ3962081.1 PTS sugar transporter subunit IIA [Erysipelotrichaceae bacterium]